MFIDHEVTRTPNLLIWSQTRYHYATQSYKLKNWNIWYTDLRHMAEGHVENLTFL